MSNSNFTQKILRSLKIKKGLITDLFRANQKSNRNAYILIVIFIITGIIIRIVEFFV